MMGWDSFSSHTSFKVGLGDRVRFWHDCWCTDRPLKEEFPGLYSCSRAQNGTVAAMLESHSEVSSRAWNVVFEKGFNDWEMAQVVSFFSIIQAHLPRSLDADRLSWSLNGKGSFDSRSFYRALCTPSSVSVLFPWKSIWKVKAPRRVVFFLWSVAWGRILTCDNLMRRGHVMAGWCCLCRAAGESVDHLRLHCDVARDLWHCVLHAFGVAWVLPNHIPALLFGWWNWFGKHSSQVWNMVPHCLMWTLWWERNSRTFEDIDHPVGRLIETLFSSLFDWARVWGLTSSCSVGNFLESLDFSSTSFDSAL